MSGHEEFDFREFLAGLAGHIDFEADIQAEAMQIVLEHSESQRALLNDLNRTVFGADVRADLEKMDEHLATDVYSNLNSMLENCLLLAGFIENVVLPQGKSGFDSERLLTVVYQRAERVTIVKAVAANRVAGPVDDKTEVQADILSSTLLTMEERLQWATEVDRLMPGQGIDLQDPDAVTAAITLYGITEEKGAADREVRRELWHRLTARLEELFTEFEIPEHDDREEVTSYMVSTIIWETDDEHDRHAFVLRQLGEQSAALGWPDGSFDRIVTELRRLKSEIGGASDAGE